MHAKHNARPVESQHELDQPHAGIRLVDLTAEPEARDQAGPARNAGPPEHDPPETSPEGAWGLVSVDGVQGYGLRAPDGAIHFWRPLPPRRPGGSPE